VLAVGEVVGVAAFAPLGSISAPERPKRLWSADQVRLAHEADAAALVERAGDWRLTAAKEGEAARARTRRR